MTAWMMLLAWLFVVSAGVANACLLEHRTHGHPLSAAAHIGAHAAGKATHGEEPDLTPGNDEPAASKAGCRKVCDESPQLPAKQSSAPDVDPPTIAATWWNRWTTRVVLDRAHGVQLCRARMPPAGPPPRLQYARLVL